MRPTTAHEGFFVPNAGDVSDPKLAEPDAIDFNTTGNTHWGVIDGCEPIISGRTVTVSSGHALVNGLLVNVTGGAVTLSAGASQPRFDLICLTAGGTIVAVVGGTSSNPVFPDVPLDHTLLGSVLCPIGATSFEDNLIDKRLLLTPIQVTNKTGAEVIFVNRTAANVDTFRILANGMIEWNDGDTSLYRHGAGVLRTPGKLMVDEDISIQGNLAAAGFADFGGNVTSANIIMAANPSGPVTNGALLLTPTAAYLGIAGVWTEFTTSASFPPGTITSSVCSPAEMGAEWLRMDGRRVNAADTPSLFAIAALFPFIQNDGQDFMLLPNMTGVVLIGGTSNIANFAGSATNEVTLTEGHLPRHGHAPVVQGDGGHAHVGDTSGAGGHQHVTDAVQHQHNIAGSTHAHASAVGTGFVAAIGTKKDTPAGTGDTMLDPIINDSAHTFYTKSSVTQTAPATSAPATTVAGGGAHQHNTNTTPDHVHSLTVSGGGHAHGIIETEFGSSNPVAVSIAQKSLITYVYIKV